MPTKVPQRKPQFELIGRKSDARIEVSERGAVAAKRAARYDKGSSVHLEAAARLESGRSLSRPFASIRWYPHQVGLGTP